MLAILAFENDLAIIEGRDISVCSECFRGILLPSYLVGCPRSCAVYFVSIISVNESMRLFVGVVSSKSVVPDHTCGAF